MKQVLIKKGRAVVDNVPAPQCEAGTVLVAVHYSCISAGTEINSVKTSGMPLWKRAVAQPDNVKKVLDSVNTIGISRTYALVTNQLSVGNPTGYSAAGTVIAVGAGIKDIHVNDRVACAGAQCAHHAEIINVPRNLVIPIPENLDYQWASTVTVGAIALQGVRRAAPTLGETFVVIGLGILGQLTVQILQANGCRVIGMDLDLKRIELAKQFGMEAGILSNVEDDKETIYRLTQNIGADGVIITAATKSDEVVAKAFKMCRKKGRVVLVGDVGLNLNRSDFYQKELDFFISCSYGPGRYDSRYEEEGLDYPVGYVRWTENRNMAEYLRLLANGKMNISALISKIYPVDQAESAYDSLSDPQAQVKPLLVLLHYPNAAQAKSKTKIDNHGLAYGNHKIRIALAGAGSFAKGMHLPNLNKLSEIFHLQAVMSRTGHNAKGTALQFAANYSTTEYQQLLDDPEINAILIATRPDLHASMALAALRAGKHVLVEKPLAILPEELQSIIEFYEQKNHEGPILLTGFNRRFSRYLQYIKQLVSARIGPMVINYRMNAGYIPMDHWVHGTQGGGRNIGEACHIYDLFTYLSDAPVTKVMAQGITPGTDYYSCIDNFIATMHFAEGTVASLVYTALGNKEYPKEQMEIFCDGIIITLNDYKSLQVIGKKNKVMNSKIMDKGQKDELAAFGHAIQQGGKWPIPLWQQIQATEISFQVEQQLRR